MAHLLGYVGYDEGGYLTKKVKQKPYSIVLFDEIEKAHPDVMNMLLQILEDGRLTDSTGRVVSFKNTIIIMTSNVGARFMAESKKLGFANSKDDKEAEMKNIQKEVLGEVKKEFRPEFINRIDEVIVFNKLSDEDLENITALLLDNLKKRLEKQEILIDIDENVKKYIVKQETEKNYGARPLRRAVQTIAEDNITDGIIRGEIKKSHKVIMTIKDDKVVFLDS